MRYASLQHLRALQVELAKARAFASSACIASGLRSKALSEVAPSTPRSQLTFTQRKASGDQSSGL